MSNKLKLIIVVSAIVVLGSAGYFLGIFKVQEKPELVLEKSYSLSQTEKIDHATNINFILKKKRQAFDTVYSDLGNLKITTFKQVDKKDLTNFNTDISFDGSVSLDSSGSKINLAGDILMLDKVFYAKLTKLPDLPAFDSSTIKDKWFNLELVNILKDFSEDVLAKQTQLYLDGSLSLGSNNKDMADAFSKYNFVSNPTYVGSENIAEHSISDISFTLDRNVFVSFVNTFIASDSFRHDTQMSDLDLMNARTTLKNFVDTMNISPVVVGIAKDNYHIYTVKTKVELTDPSYDASNPNSFQIISADISVNYDYDTPVNIAVPQNPSSAEALVKNIFGLGDQTNATDTATISQTQ